MKSIRLVLVMVASLALLVCGFAQDAKKPHMEGKKVAVAGKTMKAYACTKCEVASKTAGKCPMCGGKMVAVNAVKTKDGIVTYACEACKETASKASNCPKCGKFMKKHVLKAAKGEKKAA